MPFLTDKVMDGEFVLLRHVQVSDAEAILAAWGEERVSSTWRHHHPKSLEEERIKLQSLVEDEDRWQYLMIRKETQEIVGCIGLETNTLKDPGDNSPLNPSNCRLARMGMLLFREQRWDHRCEIEAIRLLLDATFHEKFRLSNGSRFKICDVNVRVTPDDYMTIGVLVMLGFRIPNISKAVEYHGRQTIMMDYMPPDLDLEDL